MDNKRYTEEHELERRFGRNDFRRVPEGYFPAMIGEVMAKLPEQEQEQRYVEMTRWQKLKPYVYLAAMFAGIWLMMNIFGRIITSDTVSLDNPPEAIAMAMSSLQNHDTYFIPESLASEMQIMEEVSEEFGDMDEFREAFENAGAELKADAVSSSEDFFME